MSKYSEVLDKLVKQRKRKNQQEAYKKKIENETKERQKTEGIVQTVEDS